MHLDEILRTAYELDASDVHLVAGHPPMVRVHTVVRPLEHAPLDAATLESALKSILTENQLETFRSKQDLDFSYEVANLGRYRVNAHQMRNGIGLRKILGTIHIYPTLAEANKFAQCMLTLFCPWDLHTGCN